MKKRLGALSAFLLLVGPAAHASNINDIIRDVRTAIQNGARQATPSQAAQPIPQPSFDCAKARATDERVICADLELAHFDAAISTGYEYLRSTKGDVFAKDTNAPLFHARQACGPSADCIRAAQINAIAAYHNLGAPISISNWNLNGSSMLLLAQGRSRTIFYDLPRQQMLQQGARQGSLLFEGGIDNQQYAGTAYWYHAGCLPVPFAVRGPVLDNDNRVILQGNAPNIAGNCLVQGYFQVGIELNFSDNLNTSQSGQTNVAQAQAPAPVPAPPVSESPTFDCSKAKSTTARIICLNQAGAKADWDLISAYWARYFSLPEGERPGFDTAQQAWLESLNGICRLDTRQATFSASQQQCVLNSYQKRAAGYRSQLSADALDEAGLSPEQHVAIQQSLFNLGVLHDKPDGEFGLLTRTAIKQFQRQSGLADTGFLTPQQRQTLNVPSPISAPTTLSESEISATRTEPVKHNDDAAPDAQGANSVPSPAANSTPSKPSLVVGNRSRNDGADCNKYAAYAAENFGNGTGVPFDKIDPTLAIPACEAAVRDNPDDAALKFQLGRAYTKATNYAAALDQYRDIADKGYAPAQANIGLMYINGWGLPKDAKEAFRWFQKAAVQDYVGGELNLGIAYQNGAGVERDFMQAISWYRKAAEHNNSFAELYLGIMYENGLGVSQDEHEAEMWLRKAADQGNPLAQTRLKNFLDHLAKLHDALQNGLKYARESTTNWTSSQKTNEMTDRIDVTAQSVQTNDEGAVAEVVGKCIESGIVVFTALIVDEEGKPTINFPSYSEQNRTLWGEGQPEWGTLRGTRRINAEPLDTSVFTSDEFSNKFDVLVLEDDSILSGASANNAPQQAASGPESLQQVLKAIPTVMAAMKLGMTGPQSMSTTWRALVQFTSSKGEILIRLPLFDTNVRKVIESCQLTPH